MSNDDHKKAPQSPEEMLAMIGKREDMVARDGDEGEDSGQARGPETVAREQIDLETMREAIEEYEGPPEGILLGDIIGEPPEIPTRARPIGSPFEGLDLTLEENEETKDAEDDTENHDPLADLKEAYRELCGDVLPSSGYRTPEEHEAAQDTADSEEDQDRCKGIPIDHVHISIDGQPVRPLKPSEPDADVMGYLHSRYGTEPQMRDFVEMYDVRLSTVRLAFEPHDDDDQWYYEIDANNSFDCGYIYGELSDVCDHVDQIAREILQDDLTYL